MNKKDIIVIAAVAAGGYLLYTWLKDSGQWDAWFGGTQTPAPQPTTDTQTTQTCPVPSVYRNGQCVAPDVQTQPLPAQVSLAQTLATMAKDNAYLIQGNGKMNAHQWNFYRNQLKPSNVTQDQYDLPFFSAFPNGSDQDLYTAEEFAARIQGTGLGAIVDTGSIASLQLGNSRMVRSMSFNGGFGGAFSNRRGQA